MIWFKLQWLYDIFEENFNMDAAILLLTNTDASNSIVFGVKYSKILLEDRDDHPCMKQKPVIGDNSLFCEKENGNDYDQNTVVIYHNKLIRRISLAMSR